jgi:hypothetical protein
MPSTALEKISGHPPAVVIRLEYERPPVVYCDALNDADELRLGFWLAEARPEYGELVSRALDLAARERAS